MREVHRYSRGERAADAVVHAVGFTAALAACAALAAAGDPWAPVAGDTACTMVHGGPQVATVRGTWEGAAVEAGFQRGDGCEIARWDRIAPVLQPGTTSPTNNSQ